MSEGFPTFSLAIEGFFIEKRGQGRSEDTIRDYTSTFERFCEYMGDVTIDQITSKHMTEFFIYLDNFMFSSGHTGNPATFRKLSTKTIANARTALSSLLRLGA